MPKGRQSKVDVEIAARKPDPEFDSRDWSDYREPAVPLTLTARREAFAVTWRGMTPKCPCGEVAFALDRHGEPICRLCSLLPEPGCDLHEGPAWRTELRQVRDDERTERGY